MNPDLLIYAAAATAVLLLSGAGLLILLRGRRYSKVTVAGDAQAFSKLFDDELADRLPEIDSSPQADSEADSVVWNSPNRSDWETAGPAPAEVALRPNAAGSPVLRRTEVELLARVAAHRATKVPRLVVY